MSKHTNVETDILNEDDICPICYKTVETTMDCDIIDCPFIEEEENANLNR